VLNPHGVDDAELASADESESASATGKHAQLSRWAISFALALLLHAVAALVMLLIWQKSTPPDPYGPVIVELPPPLVGEIASPREAAPRPTGMQQPSINEQIETNRTAGGPPKPGAETTARKLPAVEERKVEPSFANLAPAAPSENAEGENTRTASGGGGASAAPSGEIGGGPIDTRIAPRFGPGGLRAKKAARTLAHKATPIGRTAKTIGAQGQGHSRRLGTSPSVAINAIGARVQDRAAAAIARAKSSQEITKNAIGNGSVANLAGSISASAAGLAATNAIGMTVRAHPTIPTTIPRLTGGEQITGAVPIPFAGRGPPAAAAINGTSMNRVTLNAGAIGGPAKNAVGVLNGTGFRTRHP
jgi:hypothetical protein